MSHPDDGMLAALLDGELTGDEQRTLEAHLRECEVCRARLAEEQAMMAEADGMVEDLVPPPAGREIPVPTRRTWWVRYRPLAWAATVVLAAGLGYYSSEWRGTPARSRMPPAPTEAGQPAQGLRQNAESTAVPSSPPPAAAEQQAPSSRMEHPAPVARNEQAKGEDDGPAVTPGVGKLAADLPADTAPIPEAQLLPRDQAVTRQRADGDYMGMRVPPPAAAARNPETAARFSGAAQEVAAPPALLAAPPYGFRTSSLEDAVNVLGGSILLIEGLSPAQVEINSELPPVVRVRYTFPTLDDTVYLVQRRNDTSGVTSYRARKNNMANNLSEYQESGDSLKSVRNGLRFRVSGTVSDSLLETLVPRIH